jgi:hypothetical protein
MTRFKSIKAEVAAKAAPAEPKAPAAYSTPSRKNKRGMVGFFSPEMSLEIRQLALAEGVTMQALMGEAFDLLMRSRGKHPFGER